MSRNFTKQIRRAMPAPTFAFKSEKTYSRTWEEDEYEQILAETPEPEAPEHTGQPKKARVWIISN
jgi:hypothetical protein